MRVENGQVTGDLRLGEPLQLNGQVTGSLTVVRDGVLVLNGTCCHHLVLEERSSVELNGMVLGDVYNNGGSLVLRGTVNGDVVTTRGNTSIDEDAVIGGVVRDDT